MKALYRIGVMMILALLAVSCNDKSNGDVQVLLGSVPSDVSTVVVVDVEDMLTKAGGKVDGSKIEPGDALTKAVAGMHPGENKTIAEGIINGESGIELTTAVLFSEGYNTYLTGVVADPDKFKTFVTGVNKTPFEPKVNLEVSGNVAIKNNQFWVCVSSHNTITAEEIERFAALTDEQSFLSSKYGENFIKRDHDIYAWGNISGIMNLTGGSFSDKTMSRMVMGFLFEDAQYVTAHADFEKGKAALNVYVLNSKGEPAKYLLPKDDIDVSTVSSLGGKADLIVAAELGHKLVSKIGEALKSFGGNGMISFDDILKPIDGTVAFAGDDEDNIRGVVTVNKEPNGKLLDLLSQFGTAKIESGCIRVSKGNDMKGGFEVADYAPRFKGAFLGLVASGDIMNRTEKLSSGLKSTIFTVSSDSKGVVIKLEAEGTDSKTNFLLQMLE